MRGRGDAMSFQELSLAKFGEVLASKDPTPGGGCASALAGALASGLVAMVARTTAGNKKFVDRAGQMTAIAEEADRLRGEFLALVDEDARAFDQVMAAFRLPKETLEQQSARSQAFQQAYKAAVEPPMKVCTRSLGYWSWHSRSGSTETRARRRMRAWARSWRPRPWRAAL